MGFFLKNPKWVQVGSGFYKKKTRNLTWIRPGYHEITKKTPIYIAINTNPNSFIFQLMPPASSPSFPHFKLSAHTSSILTIVLHYLTQHTASHLTQSRSVSRFRMVVTPFTDSLSPTLMASLSPTLTASLLLSRHSRSHQILQSSAYVFPSDDLCNLASAAHVIAARMSLGDIDAGIGYERIEIGIY